MSEKHYVHPADENELVKILKQSRGWFEAYGTTLIYALAAVLAAAAVIVYIQRKPPASAPASAALLSAMKMGNMFTGSQPIPEDFQDIADQFAEFPIGAHARLRQADLLLEQAVSNMFANRAAALVELDAAQRAYERLVDRKDVQPEVRERVLAGLARVAETRCDGSAATSDAAIAAWNRVLGEYPDSKLFKSIADDRIRALKRESTRDFYAWFHQQNPKPTDSLLMPQDGRPLGTDGRPAVPDIPSPFQLPDLSFPEFGGAGSPLNLPTPAEPTPAEPTPAEPTPAEPTPAEPTPAEPTPAEPTPAEPTPAEPTPAEPTPAEPTPAEPTPAEPTPAEPAPAEPAPAEPTPAEPTPAEPTPAEPTPAEPTPAEPAPAEPTPAEPAPAEPEAETRQE